MKLTMVIPSYWGRQKSEGWREKDAVYDHPTPLDEKGTLGRVLKSLSILKNKDFNLVIIGVSAAQDIQKEVERKISSIIKETKPQMPTLLFSHSHLEKVYQYLKEKKLEKFISLLKLRGYSNVRNLCLFLPLLLDSEVALLIDDDEIFEDPLFIDKALEFIGQKMGKDKVLAVAGYYINPDHDFLLKRKILPWMIYWNNIDSMNRAFKEIIAKEPRLKPTPFAFGGNMAIHRYLFSLVPFDPSIPRGEDIDFLINARMFGFKIYLDNQLSIKHAPPPKSHPLWQRLREDIFRFVFERSKLESQKPTFPLQKVKAGDLDPYPGEFLKEDLEEKIFHSNLMLAVDYLCQEDKKGALECMRNIYLAKSEAQPKEDPFQNLLKLQKKWKKLMEFFSSEEKAQEVCHLLGYLR